MSSPVRAVVFDFGGVLITSISNQIGDVADTLGVDPSVMREVLLGPRASDPHHPWHRAERGEIAVPEIQAELAPWADAAGIALRGDEIERLLAPGAYSVVEPMIECIARLRSDGIKTALLTNTFAEFRPTMQRDLDFDRFDAVVESFAIGSRKPEPAVYVATADMLAVEHESIVYLDDFDENLEPAAALGWTTVHVRDPHDALTELGGIVGRSSYGQK